MTASPWARKQLVAANEDAAIFFRKHLLGPDGHGPREYLTDRGFEALITDTTPWTVGYAPASWTALHDHLSELGYSDDRQFAAGLVTTSRHGNPIDRFRDRITFGIRDTDHALIGFVARSSPGAPSQAPKYLNTPTTAIYNKSRSLFGIGEQAGPLRSGATPVLVEGPLDAIAIERACSSVAAKYAGVALCGTACTDQQVDAALIGEPAIAVLMLDPDPAGSGALHDAYRRLHSRVEVEAISQDCGGDPAAILYESGPAALIRQLKQTKPAADTIIDHLLQTWPASQTGAEADLVRLRAIAAVLVGLDTSDLAHHAARLRNTLPFDDVTVARELADAISRLGRQPPSLGPARRASTGHSSPQLRSTGSASRRNR